MSYLLESALGYVFLTIIFAVLALFILLLIDFALFDGAFLLAIIAKTLPEDPHDLH